MNQDLVQLLGARARGKCECCGTPFGPGFGAPTVDHFFGRAKADEVEFTCWVLRADHHREKTDNKPSAAHWLGLFVEHCVRWGRGTVNGYVEAAERAHKRLAFVEARDTLGRGLA